MTTPQDLPALAGKTIVSASIQRSAETGDEEFVALLADGTTLVVGAWQKEGHPIEMAAEIKPVVVDAEPVQPKIEAGG